MILIPTHCPACSEPLSIDFGKKDDVIKLVCTNKNCIGTQLKKLQKGIIALEIRGIGPAIIEKLLNAGITRSYDLFDPSKFNEKILIDSGEFQKGKALNILINAVKSTKSIDISKAILSLQIENIGSTFSEKIGQKLSGLTPDFSSLMLNVREQLEDHNSLLLKEINESLSKFEKFGIELIKYELPKTINIENIKKINKIVYFSGFNSESLEKYSKIVTEDLSWVIDSNNTQLLIIPDKQYIDDVVEHAKNNNIKIMTWNQIKLLFL